MSTPQPSELKTLAEILNERGSRYGTFAGHAQVTQELKNVLATGKSYKQLSYSQKEALEMILHKIGRIVNGDPNYVDSWVDIGGYSELIVKELNGIKI